MTIPVGSTLRLDRRSLVGALLGLTVWNAGAQGTPISEAPDLIPRVSLPQWPARAADLYGPAATVPWARMLSASTLLAVDATGTISGSLSLRPILAPDRLELALDLRADALFADGASITIEDVIASLNRAWAIGLQGEDAWRWQHLEAVVRTGDRQVGLVLHEPDASIPALLASWRCPIMPASWLEDIERTPSAGTPASSGLFQLQSFTADRIDYGRNDGYFQIGRPRLTGLTCLAPTSALARGTDLVTGDVDLLIDLPLLDVPMIRENPIVCWLAGRRTG